MNLPDLAASLTGAQREVLSAPYRRFDHAFYPRTAHAACRALGTLALLAETQDTIGNVMWRFTDRGWELRHHLQEGSDA